MLDIPKATAKLHSYSSESFWIFLRKYVISPFVLKSPPSTAGLLFCSIAVKLSCASLHPQQGLRPTVRWLHRCCARCLCVKDHQSRVVFYASSSDFHSPRTDFSFHCCGFFSSECTLKWDRLQRTGDGKNYENTNTEILTVRWKVRGEEETRFKTFITI